MVKAHGRGGRGYGWVPDLGDHRDYRYAGRREVLKALPAAVDLREVLADVPCYDQGALGSCTANAIAAAMEFERVHQGLTAETPSRLFIYYNERAMEGTVASDAGAMIRDGMKSVSKQGACAEAEWPYSDDGSANGAFLRKPEAPCYADALERRVLTYERIGRSLLLMKGCLAEGYPFVFGFTVYESFEEAEKWNGAQMPMPAAGEGVLGGHAVLAVGYDDARGVFIVRNSWGTNWGEAGYFYVPYAFMTQGEPAYVSDLWTVRRVTG